MTNQARRISTPSLPPPSSPPSVLLYDNGHHQQPVSPSEARGVPSPAQTLWTAPSPTQTLGHSSPELPPLASLAGLQSFPRTPSTAADHERFENTSYYTASWGSPYRHPPPSFRLDRNRSTQLGSDDFEEDASNLLFGLEHLLPRPLEEDDSPGRFNLEHLLPQPLHQDDELSQFNLEHLIPSRLPINSLDTPTRGNFRSDLTPRSNAINTRYSTEEWVRQFLDGRWNRETNDWLSESSSSESDNTGESSGNYLEPVAAKAKKSHKSNKTLNQQDFWSHFSKGQKEELGKMMASRYAPERLSKKASNSSLRTALKQSVNAEEPPQATEKSEASEAPKPMEKTATKPTTAAEPVLVPRPRKKIMVKGKGCIISIPRDIPRGTPGYPPKPMSPEAFEARLRQFESQGYDVRGTGRSELQMSPPQNRPIWPDEEEIQADRAKGHRIRIPNREEWEAYVQQLLEAKLAALGVSVPGEEEDVPSRQPSAQQPGMPFSPPLPTSSAGSQRMRQGSIVSGTFPLGPSPGHMSRQSIASPMSMFGNTRGSMHMHRHSTFASPASFVQQTASPTGAWSPGNYFSSQGARGGSPALPLSRPDLGEGVSPISPFGIRPGQQFPVGTPKDDLLVQMQQQQQQLQAQLLLQQQQQLLGLRPSSTLAEVPEDVAEEDAVPALQSSQPGPDIAVPTPRGHRHNISANLEREARDAEYHLEEAIDKQFNEGGDFSTEPETAHAQFQPSNIVAGSTWEGSRPVLHQPQPHNRAHSLAQPSQASPFSFPGPQAENPRGDSDGARTNISEVTNPSLEGESRNTAQHSKAPSQMSNSWNDSKFTFGKNGSALHSKHTSRSSISKLNVEAKEFKFNPSATFSPASMSSAFSFSAGANPEAASRNNNLDGQSGFNVAAPAFKPDAPAFKPEAPAFQPFAPVFQPSAPTFTPAVPAFRANPIIAPTMPTSGFNFFSSFKPGAPAFNPGSAEFKPSTEAAPTTFSSKIFGDVSISASDIVKPAKRSKAVPIVRPDVPRQTPERKLEEEKEDESGRPVQADGREKRARRVRDDSNDVPKFAIQPILPSQPLAESKRSQNVKDNVPAESKVLLEEKENQSPEAELVSSKSKTPEPLSGRDDGPTLEATPQTEQSTERLSSPRTSIDDKTPHESEGLESEGHTPTVEETHKLSKHGHKSSLSATAKPFEFRPSGQEFGIHVTKPSITQNEDFNNSPFNPLRHESRSPATTFRPSDDGSYKTALESRRRPHYPESESVDFDHLGQASFNDIDAVMKHMNEEGSDFGVERDGPSWDQSSPRLDVQDFGRADLRPNNIMRSDAPSPSPRGRLYAPRDAVGSSTSVARDPFDDERADPAYESPIRRLNNADDIPVSDWDEGLPSEEEEKIQTRSLFFDRHVDDLLSNLLASRLGPLENNLRDIQDSLVAISQRQGRGPRSNVSERLDSDADDEDDESIPGPHYRNRSPRKDRKMERFRAIIKETLESYQPPAASAPVPDLGITLPEKIREVVAEVLVAHQPSFEPVPADQIRSIVEEAIQAHKPADPAPVESLKPEEVRSIVAEVVAASIPQPAAPTAEPVKAEDIRSIVMEVFATHAPQPAPVQEQIRPDDIKSLIMEALDSRTPAAEPPDTIRAIVAEALASHKPPTLEAPIDIPQPQVDLSEIYQVIGSLKASIAQTTSHNLHAEDIRELLDDAFKRQSMEVAKREESQAILERDARIADLESKLEETSLRLEAESAARQDLERAEIDRARLLKVTEEELNLLRQSAADDENKIRALREECEVAHRTLDAVYADDKEIRAKVAALEAENEELKLKAIAYETSEGDIKKKLDVVTAENEALTFTLEEHRISANKWRNEIQQAHQENEQMRKAIEQSRFQAEEAARVREMMRAKFDKLQQEMTVAAGQVAAERAQWQKNDEAHAKRYEVLSARIEAEGRTRERLERELERLETQEREAMKLRIVLEQAQKNNKQLEETIEQLKQECLEHQKAAERYERDYREARETGHVEIRRTRVLLEADIEAANNQVNIVRRDLEAEISRLRLLLDNVRMDADTLKVKHELELEAASDAKKAAVEDALRSKNAALQEIEQAFNRRLEQLSQEHSRALELSREDKNRAEAYFKDRLSLADSKMEHLHEKLALMEERLTIAKEAASAAAAAAQSAKADSTSTRPEKISPQALRESIAVLQEQLQERETRIESLESKLAEVDIDAPNKLKERDAEIAWLRELLGVRVDDLNDLINALAQPSFDREAVRDAAIRIRTNLQMEQHEKERLMTGNNQSFPTLATLSNFASPKAVQLAAAFGNWRKGRENASSALAGNSSSRNQTPSRVQVPASAQSFLSGLMTPPTSNLRRTPDIASSSRRRPEGHSLLRTASGSDAGFPSLGKHPAPSTPPLLRSAAYDQDAEDGGFSESGFYDDESTVDGGETTPVEIRFGRELLRREGEGEGEGEGEVRSE
ncbi:uncharacterized protein EI97DRAFT_378095 [Westerdykella ornata]|uniref:Myosin class II heavy chain n=1 Tax=Westerdykella ornata TaxID=318751 RepID=A0A6A6JI23_WESOR|nr:uncharacterized protein EI97DRAFT_378095 [Westerdykella ornata]KAF2276201.1 hypothetical protein EI97DRAFT_378095 [Westerdykella ornata]